MIPRDPFPLRLCFLKCRAGCGTARAIDLAAVQVTSSAAWRHVHLVGKVARLRRSGFSDRSPACRVLIGFQPPRFGAGVSVTALNT